MTDRTYLTTGQVARILHTTEKTVRRWCNEGDIPAFKPGRGSRWLIPADAIQFPHAEAAHVSTR